MDFAYLVEFMCDAGVTKSQRTLFILDLEGSMLCRMRMYAYSGPWLKNTHWRTSFSMKRDGFTDIHYKYLYRERSRTSVSGLLHKVVSLKSRLDALLTHYDGRPSVFTKICLAVQSVAWAQFTGRL